MHVAGFALVMQYTRLPFELETIQLGLWEGHWPDCNTIDS